MTETHLDPLFCSEENEDIEICNENGKPPSFFPLEQELIYKDEEILSLFFKEEESHFNFQILESDSAFSFLRCEAVTWMLKVKDFYGFSVLTAILSVNYFDRFLCSRFEFEKEKAWMLQLVGVSCISLAAKVEETHIPLLLDLQIEDTKYIFEAKTIQKMELLLLSTLQWKMHPITPLSFLHHIIRRLGLKTHLHRQFLRRSERLLLLLVSELRFVRFLPSVLATATMMNVMDEIEPCNSIDYHNQLLGVLQMNKEKVNECYKLIKGETKKKKRKYEQNSGSPNGVIEASNSSEAIKKSRVEVEDQNERMNFPAILNRVFVGIVDGHC